jgi:cell division septal protein FtsQ
MSSFFKIVILLLLTWGVYQFDQSDLLKVKINWKIDPNLSESQAVLNQHIQSLISNKYTIDLNKIKRVLSQNSQVESVQVRRVFWNEISIKINAKHIALRWKNARCDGNKPCFGYISSQGKLFIPKKKIISNQIIATTFSDEKTVKHAFESYALYQQILGKNTVKSLSSTHIDTLTLKPNITVVLGRQLQKTRLLKFKRIYQALKKQGKDLKDGVFDMRYNKGFSFKNTDKY